VSEPSLQQSELKFCFTEYSKRAVTVPVRPILCRRKGQHTRILSVFGISIPNVQNSSRTMVTHLSPIIRYHTHDADPVSHKTSSPCIR